jgi:hypothetical protein
VSVRTFERDAVEVLRASDLRGHLHVAADERLGEHVLHGLRKLLLVRQLVQHGDRILTGAQTTDEIRCRREMQR